LAKAVVDGATTGALSGCSSVALKKKEEIMIKKFREWRDLIVSRSAH